MKSLNVAAIALLLVLGPTSVYCAESDSSPATTTDITVASDSTHFEKGNQTISLSAGVHVPLFISDTSFNVTEPHLYTGALFSFTYQDFIAPGLAIGGTLSGAFEQSIAASSFFIAPLSFRCAYWWNLGPFDADLAAEAGAYIMRYTSNNAYGPFFKLGGGASWRISNSWSIGLEPYYWLVPEIHTGSSASLTRFGNFLEVSLSASYHL
jgi:hypothetical protein